MSSRRTPSRLIIAAVGLACLWFGVTGVLDGAVVAPSRYGTQVISHETAPGDYWLLVGFYLIGGLVLLAACVKWRRGGAPE
jgi:hypothetical protein